MPQRPPGWLAATMDVVVWGGRYTRRVYSWRLPTSRTKQDELATAHGTDGFALLTAVYAPGAPGWLRCPPLTCCAACWCRTTPGPPAAAGGRRT
ncbi:hypothetical protein [Candidatus Protofrankia californiensis]|uniref:hypothetical protein n=1 Tax=Candidatus Protofrankia californiensis TaxID=1839754 RepID=UPI00104140D7|nr:hypothetical protein [Candidatus Protofrankia californiensis]